METTNPATVLKLLEAAPGVLEEMTNEFIRRGDECLRGDDKSQLTACFLLALRSVSMLSSMGVLLKPTTRDSFDVLARAFMESRDLLMTFRFDDRGSREKIRFWFEGKRDSAWKADHFKCEQFLTTRGAENVVLGERWNMFTVLSHPTFYAAEHSAASLLSRMAGRTKAEELSHSMMVKRADFLLAIARLILATTFDLPGWISLGLAMSRMPHVEPFRESAELIAVPILGQSMERGLPPKSYMPASDRSAKKAKAKS